MIKLNLQTDKDGRIYFTETDPVLVKHFGSKAYIDEEYLNEEDDEMLKQVYKNGDKRLYTQFIDYIEENYLYYKGTLLKQKIIKS